MGLVNSDAMSYPELLAVTPCCEAEVEIPFDWIVNKNKKLLLRLESIPVDMQLDYPTSKELICGQGIYLTESFDEQNSSPTGH